MDRNPGIRTSDRRTARPHYPPCQHSRDERRQLSSGPKPRPKGWLKPFQNRRARMRPPLGLRPPGGLMRAPQVAWFCSALWPEFTPALTHEFVLDQEDKVMEHKALMEKFHAMEHKSGRAHV